MRIVGVCRLRQGVLPKNTGVGHGELGGEGASGGHYSFPAASQREEGTHGAVDMPVPPQVQKL